MSTEQGLLLAVQNLTEVVKALDRTLGDEYPKRKEIERRFATKQESRDRLFVGLLALLFGILSSIFVSAGIVSYCLLDTQIESVDNKPACQMIPGYLNDQQRNANIVTEFRQLQDKVETSERQLNDLRRQISNLRGQLTNRRQG